MKKELEVILRSHEMWLNDEGGQRADLYDTDLRGADLRGANLHCTDLRGANISSVNVNEETTFFLFNAQKKVLLLHTRVLKTIL